MFIEMQPSIFFVLLIGGFLLILLFFNLFSLFYFYLTNRRINLLLEKGEIKNFKDIFLRQNERIKELEDLIKQAFLKIEDLEQISKISIQKVGVVRYKPLNEIGGNQSFSLALLDKENNGFVISSLFLKEGNRVFVKPIKKGESEYLLSEEEKKVIEIAIKNNKKIKE